MLNSCTNASTGVSPFFLYHSYYNTPFPQKEAILDTREASIAAKEIVRTIIIIIIILI